MIKDQPQSHALFLSLCIVRTNVNIPWN